MSKEEVEQFLTALAVERHVSAATQNQALHALLFLYREVLAQELGWLDNMVPAKRSQRLPTVLTQQEGIQRRHHLYESVPQRALKEAARKVGLTKPANPHILRHSFENGILPNEFRDLTAYFHSRPLPRS